MCAVPSSSPFQELIAPPRMPTAAPRKRAAMRDFDPIGTKATRLQ
jgi:hypothetical protein